MSKLLSAEERARIKTVWDGSFPIGYEYPNLIAAAKKDIASLAESDAEREHITGELVKALRVALDDAERSEGGGWIKSNRIMEAALALAESSATEVAG